ncbi:response regulator transcription factor [Rhizobium halophytocola]|uniref:Two-component system response regulator DctR n=1 Tax=Rhizobium halophytocola TaxID=735519 RepID=A0ABS4E396_9HYPH|nr:response regulator [Rhizobium halophytocola]MBP1852417.1 two-component system response regulator DctR [Rhizobium halophytocola]
MSERPDFLKKATVYLVDDEPVIRDALSFLFMSRGLKVTALDSGEALLDAVPLDPLACVILDMRMEGLSGLETFYRLKSTETEVPVIFLTGHGDVPIAVEALKSGATDFIEKPFNDNQLVNTVLKCLELRDSELDVSRDKAAIEKQYRELSARELDVLRLLLAGRLNKQIADELAISMRTVEVHRARILAKMGVRNAIELAATLASHGITVG